MFKFHKILSPLNQTKMSRWPETTVSHFCGWVHDTFTNAPIQPCGNYLDFVSILFLLKISVKPTSCWFIIHLITTWEIVHTDISTCGIANKRKNWKYINCGIHNIMWLCWIVIGSTDPVSTFSHPALTPKSLTLRGWDKDFPCLLI